MDDQLSLSYWTNRCGNYEAKISELVEWKEQTKHVGAINVSMEKQIAELEAHIERLRKLPDIINTFPRGSTPEEHINMWHRVFAVQDSTPAQSLIHIKQDAIRESAKWLGDKGIIISTDDAEKLLNDYADNLESKG